MGKLLDESPKSPTRWVVGVLKISKLFLVPSLMDEPLDLECPDCGEQINKTLRELELDNDVVCPGCGRTIRTDANDAIAAAKPIDNACE